MNVNEFRQLEYKLSKLFKKFKNFDYVLIKCCKENELNAELKMLFIGAKFSVTTIEGYYHTNGDKEAYFLVYDCKSKGNLRELLIKSGRYFKQERIVFHNAANNETKLIEILKENVPCEEEIKLDNPYFENEKFYLPLKDALFVAQDTVSDERHQFNDTILFYTTWHKQYIVTCYDKFYKENLQ